MNRKNKTQIFQQLKILEISFVSSHFIFKDTNKCIFILSLLSNKGAKKIHFVDFLDFISRFHSPNINIHLCIDINNKLLVNVANNFNKCVYKYYQHCDLEWHFGRGVCQAFLSIDYTASTASIFNLFILSLDRYTTFTVYTAS